MNQCPHHGKDPHFLEGIADPTRPLDMVEGWVAVLHARDPMEAHLAAGYLETMGFEVMIYPLQEATGFEQFAYPGISAELLGGGAPSRMLPVRVLVEPAEVAEALAALIELRERPEEPGGDAPSGTTPTGP